jgi:hypothetical protein
VGIFAQRTTHIIDGVFSSGHGIQIGSSSCSARLILRTAEKQPLCHSVAAACSAIQLRHGRHISREVIPTRLPRAFDFENARCVCGKSKPETRHPIFQFDTPPVGFEFRPHRRMK